MKSEEELLLSQENILKSIVIAYARTYTRDPLANTHAFVWVVDFECLIISRLLIPIVTLTTNNLLSTLFIVCESIDLLHPHPICRRLCSSFFIILIKKYMQLVGIRDNTEWASVRRLEAFITNDSSLNWLERTKPPWNRISF